MKTKVSFSTKNYNVDPNGIVRHKKTGEILTVLGYPSRRQKIRLWLKSFRKQLGNVAKAASYSINR